MNIEQLPTHDASSRVRTRLTAWRKTAATLAMLVSCAGGASAGTISALPGATVPTPLTTATDVVRISENRLLRDGVPWVPHAVQMVAFVAPPRFQTGAFLAAYRHYNISEFAAIKAWGADSVRMQLSQPGADPDDPKYDQDFVNKFIAGVKAARAAGLVVIVSIQDEEQSGEESPADLPNAATRHVWATLAPQLNGDDGIVYEMFNEPRPKPSAANWASWADAMDAVVATIRDTGATNTLLADGLNFAETLDGVIPLDDPLHRMAYSSHPYFHNRFDQSEKAWNRKFGAVAARLPVIVGEWTSATTYFLRRGYGGRRTRDAQVHGGAQHRSCRCHLRLRPAALRRHRQRLSRHAYRVRRRQSLQGRRLRARHAGAEMVSDGIGAGRAALTPPRIGDRN